MTYSFSPATDNGFINLYTKWRKISSDAPLEYAESMAVFLLAAVGAARMHFRVQQSMQPSACNLYLVLVGPSTIARKSSSLAAADHLLYRVAGQRGWLISMPGSAEGLAEDLQHHEENGAALLVDELAYQMAGWKTKSHLKDMPGMLMRAYDSAPISLRNKSKQVKGSSERVQDEVKVRRPVLSIAAGATPERLSSVSTRSDVDDGWWPRWAVVWPQELPPRMPVGPRLAEQDAIEEELCRQLSGFDERLGRGISVNFSERAWKCIDSVVASLESDSASDSANAAMYGRADARIFRVAALLALTHDDSKGGSIFVDANDVLDATRLVQNWLRDAIRLVDQLGIDEFEREVMRTLDYARHQGQTVRRSAIAQAMRIKASRFREIEESLRERSLINPFEYDGAMYWQVLNLEAPQG